MDEKDGVGRHTQRPSGLSDADRARIRAEEEYRLQIQAELKQPAPIVPAPAPAQKQSAAERRQKLLEIERDRQEREAQNPELPKRNPFLMSSEDNEIYNTVKRERLPPAEKAKAENKSAVGCLVIGAVIVVSCVIVFRACSQDFSQGRAAAQSRREAAAAAAKTLQGQSPYVIQQACESSLSKKLKSPSTAKFAEDTQPVTTAGGWTWSSSVDAQNSFGAPIRTAFLCTVKGTTPEDAVVETLLLE